MNLFIIGSPIETAKALDSERLDKQILECQLLINMSDDDTFKLNHPVFLMYKNHMDWVRLYKSCLSNYRDYKSSGFEEFLNEAQNCSDKAEAIKPNFMCQDLYDSSKSRLYLEDENKYRCFLQYGKPSGNHYYIDGHWIKYEKGKKIIDDSFGNS